MSDTARFHVTPLSTFQLSQALALVLNRENLDVIELDPIAASVLGRCQGHSTRTPLRLGKAG